MPKAVSLQLPFLNLNGAPFCRVAKFKYLNHWFTYYLKDKLDIDREGTQIAGRPLYLICWSEDLQFVQNRLKFRLSHTSFIHNHYTCAAIGLILVVY